MLSLPSWSTYTRPRWAFLRILSIQFFPTYPQGHAYVATGRSPVASILGIIRAGHTSDEKTRLVRALWKMFQDKTKISDRNLSVALQEVPASQAMENGAIMPDVGHEK